MTETTEHIEYDDDLHAIRTHRTRRFRGLIVSAGCIALSAAWLVFTGVPVVALAWWYWFGAGS